MTMLQRFAAMVGISLATLAAISVANGGGYASALVFAVGAGIEMITLVRVLESEED